MPMRPLADLALLVGRIALVALFLISGWAKLIDLAGTAGYLQSLGVPAPTLAAIAAAVVELGAAALIVVGFSTRLSALALLVFTAIATALAHAYWTVPPGQQEIEFITFWKNVAVAGGLLMLAAMGAGRLSIDGLRR